jgi:hypothetical protein
VNKPKTIGTKAETAVTRYLTAHGFPHAERRSLRGVLDAGDITGCPGICIEVKGGEAARNASDLLVTDWLAETETERVNAHADVGILVIQRRGVGPANAGRWWAVMDAATLFQIHGGSVVWGLLGAAYTAGMPVRMVLADAVRLLRAAGYGQPLLYDEEVAV